MFVVARFLLAASLIVALASAGWSVPWVLDGEASSGRAHVHGERHDDGAGDGERSDDHGSRCLACVIAAYLDLPTVYLASPLPARRVLVAGSAPRSHERIIVFRSRAPPPARSDTHLTTAT